MAINQVTEDSGRIQRSRTKALSEAQELIGKLQQISDPEILPPSIHHTPGPWPNDQTPAFSTNEPTPSQTQTMPKPRPTQSRLSQFSRTTTLPTKEHASNNANPSPKSLPKFTHVNRAASPDITSAKSTLPDEAVIQHASQKSPPTSASADGAANRDSMSLTSATADDVEFQSAPQKTPPTFAHADGAAYRNASPQWPINSAPADGLSLSPQSPTIVRDAFTTQKRPPISHLITEILEQKIPPLGPSQFKFELDHDSANHNASLLELHNFDLRQAILSDGNSPLRYGSEFRPLEILEPLLKVHPLWPRIESLIRHGSHFSATPFPTDKCLEQVNAALAYGNHKGALKHPDKLFDLLDEDVTHGFNLPLPISVSRKIPGLLLSPMNIVLWRHLQNRHRMR